MVFLILIFKKRTQVKKKKKFRNNLNGNHQNKQLFVGPNKPNEVLRDQIAKYTNRVKNTLTKKNLDIVLLPSTMDNVAINCMLELLMDSKDVPKPTQPLPGSFAASLPEKAVIWNLLGFIN